MKEKIIEVKLQDNKKSYEEYVKKYEQMIKNNTIKSSK